MYTNLPAGRSSNLSAQAYSNAYTPPLELETNTFNLLKGFFEGHGFDKPAAETIAVTFIRQAKQDGYNPLEVLSTLKGMNNLELNDVIIQILNYNRFKSSYIGTKISPNPFPPVNRNVLP
jgi:hypothetical protein